MVDAEFPQHELCIGEHHLSGGNSPVLFTLAFRPNAEEETNW